MRTWAEVDGKQSRVLSQTPPSHRPESPYSTAELFITQHGDDAISYAEKEMSDCQASGDGDGYLVWGRIADAILELQETEQWGRPTAKLNPDFPA